MGSGTVGGAVLGAAVMPIQHVVLLWAAQEKHWPNGTDFWSGYVIWGCGNGSGYENVTWSAHGNENGMSYLNETEFWIFSWSPQQA